MDQLIKSAFGIPKARAAILSVSSSLERLLIAVKALPSATSFTQRVIPFIATPSSFF